MIPNVLKIVFDFKLHNNNNNIDNLVLKFCRDIMLIYNIFKQIV